MVNLSSLPPFAFRLCPRSDTPIAAARFRATHLVSVLDPGTTLPTSAGIPSGHMLQMWCADTANPAAPCAPTIGLVSLLLRFGQTLPSHARVIFQSESGRRRSAAAYLLTTQTLGPGTSVVAFARIRSAYPDVRPNPLFLWLGAGLLGRPDLIPAVTPAQPLAANP